MRVNESIDPSGILLPKSYDVENVPNHFGLSQYDSDAFRADVLIVPVLITV